MRPSGSILSSAAESRFDDVCTVSRLTSTWWRYFWTVRYLQPRQVFFQVRRRLPVARRCHAESDNTVRHLVLTRPVGRRPSYVEPATFKFLHQTVDLGEPIDWRASAQSMLWRYNLHYFDYLHQRGLPFKAGEKLISGWIGYHTGAECGVGWEPYPLSLRIVNWLKFMSMHAEFPQAWIASVSRQATYLCQHIEYHLLGNHLFANAKALWFAGVFLGMAGIAHLGRRIVLDQLAEQFLDDGGHFELSPMYHSIAVEDLLDLINLCQATGDDGALAPLRKTATRALDWLGQMVNDAGRIPLLNDSTWHIAPEHCDLNDYAERLHVERREWNRAVEFRHGWLGQNLSGYWILKLGDVRLIFDCAALGPSYLPGHAHCDMLNLLFEREGSPIFADTGVYEYAESARRTYSRSTAAHNTVSLDDLEQGDIWKSFRMGKRGHPRGMRFDESGISCEHTGFNMWRRGLVHRRILSLGEHGFEMTDEVCGPATHRFRAAFHLAPGIDLRRIAENRFTDRRGNLLEFSGATANLGTSEFYPEFGVIENRQCLVLTGEFTRKHHFSLKCTFSS